MKDKKKPFISKNDFASEFLTGLWREHHDFEFYLYFTEVVIIGPISLLMTLRASWHRVSQGHMANKWCVQTPLKYCSQFSSF